MPQAFLYYITILSGIYSTILVYDKLMANKVMASAIACLVFSMPFIWIKIDIVYSVIFAGGTFIAMSEDRLLKKHWLNILYALLYTLIFLLTQKYFIGFGGKAGMIAFLVVYAFVSLRKLIRF